MVLCAVNACRSEQLKKAVNGEIRMPLSLANVDIWGRDIARANGYLKVVMLTVAVVGLDAGLCQT